MPQFTKTTGFAPFQLIFWRTPRLPVYLLFGSVLRDDQLVDYDAYVQRLRHDLAEAIKIAQTSSTKQQQKQADVEVGARVLLANKGERGKRKLAVRWENNLYTIQPIERRWSIEMSTPCLYHLGLKMTAPV
jgi:hypothetical protein